MDPRERIEDLRVFMTTALDGRQAEIWTALPGFVVSYNAARQTCQVQPTIAMQVVDPLNTDNPKQLNLPILDDCPVVFPHGGGFTLTFPIQPGDECLVVFSSRCIDGWWSQGPTKGVNQLQPPQGDLRMHDLSDGFVLVGPRSLPNALSNVSTDTVQLRSDDGQAYVEIAAGHVVNITTPATINLHAPGGINVTGPTVFTGTVHANGHSIDETHRHSGVQTGGSNTGPVT